MTNVHVLAPVQYCIDDVLASSSMVPFDESIVAFLSVLSKRILTDNQCKNYPELVALGFWLRASNIESLKQKCTRENSKALGLVIHFTPANVDTMFVYSWVCSLLMGNKNVVRIASQESTMQSALLHVLDSVLQSDRHSQLARMNVFVRFDKDSGYSEKLSMLADARVIWGGDDSVNAIRALPCRPRSRDISFADRYSACLINSGNLDDIDEIDKLAEMLWRDTKPFDQHACSSPKIVYWMGDSSKIKELFLSVNKMAKEQSQAIELANNHFVLGQLIRSTQPNCHVYLQDRISAIGVDETKMVDLTWHTGAGFYIVKLITGMDELITGIDEKLQTLSFWNISQQQILKLSEQSSIRGLDRIVPVGRALDFSPTWDGFDLFNQLSRQIDIIF